MSDTVKLVLVSILAVLFGLSALARRLPHVAWLRPFAGLFPRLGEAERARVQGRADVYAGIQLILMGLALPLLYVITTVMLFNTPSSTGIAVTFAGSVVLIVLGSLAIRSGRRRQARGRRSVDPDDVRRMLDRDFERLGHLVRPARPDRCDAAARRPTDSGRGAYASDALRDHLGSPRAQPVVDPGVRVGARGRAHVVQSLIEMKP